MKGFGTPKVINGNYPDDWLRMYAGPGSICKTRSYGTTFNILALIWDETYRLYAGRISPDFIDKATDSDYVTA